MKRKIIGIFVCILLIASAVLPVTGNIMVKIIDDGKDEIQASLDEFFRNEKFEYVKGEVLVKLNEDAPDNYIDFICNSHELDLIKDFAYIDWYHLRITADETVESKLYSLLLDPYVKDAEPNAIRHASNLAGLRKPRHLKTPNDPYYPLQWNLNNYGINPGVPTGFIDADIDAPQAWEHLTDSNIVVAVLDTGIDYSHPDLGGNVWENGGEMGTDQNGNDKRDNNVDDDGNGYIDDWHGWDFTDNDNDPMDGHGHGTHCAGIIGAIGNNGAGITGVCWKIKIIPVKVLRRDGILVDTALSDGINYSVANGARVLSCSLGGPGDTNFIGDSIKKAGDKGVLVVCAAGNDGFDVDAGNAIYPVCYPFDNVIGVAASDNVDDRWLDTNYGTTSVDLFAPGQYILSLGLHNGYAGGNCIFRDEDDSNTVTKDDVRLMDQGTPALGAGFVGKDDGDVGFPLKEFVPLEKHRENVLENEDYDEGELVYFDTDNDDVVTKGDIRLMDVTEGGEEYDLGSTVWTGDNDIGQDLVPFKDDEKYAIYTWKTGTSMAAPHVSGAIAHFWTFFPDLDHLKIKEWLLKPHRVDSRTDLQNKVVFGLHEDARLRMICGDDYGDAPDRYKKKNHRYPVKERFMGGSHEDIGEEWLGHIENTADVSPEIDADVESFYDADPGVFPNIKPDRKPEDPVPEYKPPYSSCDLEEYDDGVKLPGWLQIGKANTIYYSIMTESEDITDLRGGRYRGTPETNVYINIWIDWNQDGFWDPNTERVFTKSHNPTNEWKGKHCSGWLAANIQVPKNLKRGIYWLRARLDYGENTVGSVAPKLYDSDDNLYYTTALAQYGEVEDYIIPLLDIPPEWPPYEFEEDGVPDWPPTGWAMVVNDGRGIWEPTTRSFCKPPNHGGTCFMSADSHYNPGVIYDTEIFTPYMDMTGVEGVMLECDGNMWNPEGSEAMAEIKVYSGELVIPLYQSFGDPDAGGMHHTYTFTPLEFPDPTHVRVGFYYITAGGDDAGNFAIDNLEIYDVEDNYFINENFNEYCDAGGFPPEGWTVIKNTNEISQGNPCYWHSSDKKAGGGERSACVWTGKQIQDEWLITPPMDLSGDIMGSYLEFWTYNYGSGPNEGYWEGDYIKVSTDGGESWDTIMNLHEEAPEAPDGFLGETLQIDLSDYIGNSDVQVAFHRLTDINLCSIGPWFIDSVTYYVIPSSDPPITPSINGPKAGNPGRDYTFTISTNDPEDDNVLYQIDWGDGTELEGWMGPYQSDEAVEITHSWNEKGTYEIKVKAKDMFEMESDWGTFQVEMPKNKPYINRPFLRFLENHPRLFPILRHLLLGL